MGVWGPSVPGVRGLVLWCPGRGPGGPVSLLVSLEGWESWAGWKARSRLGVGICWTGRAPGGLLGVWPGRALWVR